MVGFLSADDGDNLGFVALNPSCLNWEATSDHKIMEDATHLDITGSLEVPLHGLAADSLGADAETEAWSPGAAFRTLLDNDARIPIAELGERNAIKAHLMVDAEVALPPIAAQMPLSDDNTRERQQVGVISAQYDMPEITDLGTIEVITTGESDAHYHVSETTGEAGVDFSSPVLKQLATLSPSAIGALPPKSGLDVTPESAGVELHTPLHVSSVKTNARFRQRARSSLLTEHQLAHLEERLRAGAVEEASLVEIAGHLDLPVSRVKNWFFNNQHRKGRGRKRCLIQASPTADPQLLAAAIASASAIKKKTSKSITRTAPLKRQVSAQEQKRKKNSMDASVRARRLEKSGSRSGLGTSAESERGFSDWVTEVADIVERGDGKRRIKKSVRVLEEEWAQAGTASSSNTSVGKMGGSSTAGAAGSLKRVRVPQAHETAEGSLLKHSHTEGAIRAMRQALKEEDTDDETEDQRDITLCSLCGLTLGSIAGSCICLPSSSSSVVASCSRPATSSASSVCATKQNTKLAPHTTETAPSLLGVDAGTTPQQMLPPLNMQHILPSLIPSTNKPDSAAALHNKSVLSWHMAPDNFYQTVLWQQFCLQRFQLQRSFLMRKAWRNREGETVQ
eukprot:gb/GEZN01003837.1/.p1 GENE.gb/GEZN01003837.1/~~gb/GEZN01003837.1/.p1  ORF type:complete len:622 (+),score=91.50 gb/GEZN01003837.1/:105-1970(+)